MTFSLDEVDKRILRIIQDEPGLSLQAIGEKVNLSATPCWRRVKRLEHDGVIMGHATLLNAEALGYPITIFAEIKLHQHDEDTLVQLERAIAEQDQILECFSMSGDHDFILRIIARSVSDYEQFLKKVLLHLPGVTSVNSSFALKCIKLTNKLPV